MGGGTTGQIVDVLIHHAATGGNTAPACPLHPPALQKQALHSCYGNGGGSHQLHPISVGVRQGLNASVLRLRWVPFIGQPWAVVASRWLKLRT